MGNEMAAKVLLDPIMEDLAKMKALQESQSEQGKHGWDTEDCSGNMTVLKDQVTVKRGQSGGSVEAIRGKIGYKGGTHFFDFCWTPGSRKRVEIGIATQDAELEVSDSDMALGSSDDSLGLDLVSRKIYFNGLVVKEYPAQKTEDFVLPSCITMILDMKEGTLGFKTDNEDYGIAMSGLQHVSDCFYVAGGLSCSGDTLTMKYLGSSDSIEKSSKLQFHDICGRNIVLQERNRRALRKNPKDVFDHATVLTNRPLQEKEMFKVLLVTQDTSRWHGSWMIGVTTTAPMELKFPGEMESHKQGEIWIYSGSRIMHNKQGVEELNGDIDDLKPGSTLAVNISNGNLQFYIDNVEQTSLKIDTTKPWFGFVDLYGQCTCVDLVDTSKALQPQRSTTSSTEIRVPKSPEEFLKHLNSAVDHLKTMEKSNIPTVKEVVRLQLDEIYHKIKDRKLKRLAADSLAGMGAAKVFTQYLKFLHGLGIEDDTDVSDLYDSLRSVCCDYCDDSLLLAKKFGEEGLLQFLIKELRDHSGHYRRSKRLTMTVLTAFGILHNCAKVSDNKAIYQDHKFVQVAGPYKDTKSNPDIIVMPCIFTMSYVFLDSEVDEITVPESTAQLAVTTLNGAVTNEETHQHDGWHAYELAAGMTNLCANQTNIKLFVQKGGVRALQQMLEFEDSYEQESALNAIWSLTTDSNKYTVRSTPNLADKVESLVNSSEENVAQAAVRLKVKLGLNKIDEPRNRSVYETVMFTKVPTRTCSYKDICRQFLIPLEIAESYFEKSNNICYCVMCHSARGVKNTVSRGEPPKEYGLPVGWYRFGLKLPARAEAIKAPQKWHRAFHGTRKEAIKKILEVGDIVPAGRAVLGGEKIKEQPFHFNDDNKPIGFDTKQVFLSPSMRYSAVDTYAKPSLFTVSSKSYKAKVALHVLIAPGSYEVGPETIGAMTEIDPSFSNQELEWSTAQQGATILYGILVKLEEQK